MFYSRPNEVSVEIAANEPPHNHTLPPSVEWDGRETEPHRLGHALHVRRCQTPKVGRRAALHHLRIQYSQARINGTLTLLPGAWERSPVSHRCGVRSKSKPASKNEKGRGLRTRSSKKSTGCCRVGAGEITRSPGETKSKIRQEQRVYAIPAR